jgi:branched-chain amino acid transport system permease protein
MLIIGGSLTVSGAVVGTFAVTIAYELLRYTESTINIAQVFSKPLVGLTEVVLACAMIVVLIVRPAGIMGAREIGAWKIFRK